VRLLSFTFFILKFYMNSLHILNLQQYFRNVSIVFLEVFFNEEIFQNFTLTSTIFLPLQKLALLFFFALRGL